MMITIVLYLFLKTIFVSLQSYSFLSAYKKSVLIGYDLVFLPLQVYDKAGQKPLNGYLSSRRFSFEII